MRSSGDDPYKRPLRLLEPPPDWQTIVSRLIVENEKRPVAVMVCGPKGAGKSSFCRNISNSLLSKGQVIQGRINKVAFIDLDPGQPELSPPGELSLVLLQSCILGPPFTHPTVCGGNEVIRAHHFGYPYLKENIDHYYRCALDLYNHYQQLARSRGPCPLIVNCSGWIQGSGFEILATLITKLNLTDVIYMSTSGPEEVIDALSEAATQMNTSLHQLSSQASNVATRTAADLRMMQTVSYFHLDEAEGSNLRWNPYPLTSQPPFVVHYADRKQAIHAVMILGDAQNPEFLGSILEGSVVSISVIEAETAFSASSHERDRREAHGNDERQGSFTADAMQDIDDLEFDGDPDQKSPTIPRTPEGIPYIPATHHIVGPLSPAHSYSLGQALIRSIDTRAQAFHILTPVPPSRLAELHNHPNRKIVLVRGRLDTPTWAYAEDINYERERARIRERELGSGDEGCGQEDVRQWAAKQPWASVVDGGRSGSGKIRRTRRDIRYRGQQGTEASGT